MGSNDFPETVTADDVAELAGVSRWTVNRAFKKEASISERARKKVLEAAKKLGYAPNLLAASLATDRSHLIAVLIDDFENPHKLVMIQQLTHILRQNGWDTLLVNTLDEDDASAALLNASQRRVDAAVLIGSRFNYQVLATALGAQRIKKLIVFSRHSSHPNTISICCEDSDAQESITEHILKKGYKKPVFIEGPQTRSAHLLRKETFLVRWLHERGEEASSFAVEAYDPVRAKLRVAEFLKNCPVEERPDIFVCENDALAMGAMDAIRYDFGLKVPEDIAVTGFDNVPLASNPNYQLTTYTQPIEEMAEGLVQALRGEADESTLSGFIGELVVRESA